MSEQNTNQADVNNGGQVNASTADTSGVNTGESTKTLEFTQDALNAMLKDARLGGEKSILKKLSVKDKGDVPAIVEKLAKLEEIESNTTSDSDKLKELQEKYEAQNNDFTATLSLLEEYKMKDVLLKQHGVSDPEDLEIYMLRVQKLVDDDTDFEVAAKNYFKDKPYKQKEEPNKPPTQATYVGSTSNKKNNNKPPTNYTQALFGGRK